MIAEQLIRHVLTEDPLAKAKDRIQTRAVGAIIRERYDALHGGALQRVRASVPTEKTDGPADHRVTG